MLVGTDQVNSAGLGVVTLGEAAGVILEDGQAFRGAAGGR